MFRQTVFVLAAFSIGFTAPVFAGSAAKLERLERRFEEYDRRLVAIEAKIELLLDFLKQGQGIVNRSSPVRRDPGIEGAGTGGSPFSTMVRKRVTENGTNIHQLPRSSSTVIARVNAGTMLDVRDRTENGDWYQVMMPGGISGYVSGRFLD